MTFSSRRAISCLGCTPTRRSTSRPPLSTSRVGMLRRSNRAAVRGLSSTLSFTTRTRPAISVASSSITGAIIRHGPHHGAHASISTGSGEASTSEAKVASVTTIGAPPPEGAAASGSGALHRPQTGSRPRATLSGGTRLVAPQAEQRIIRGSAIGVLSSDLLGAAPLHQLPAQVLARMLERAPDLRLGGAEGPRDLGDLEPVDVPEPDGSAPDHRHPGQRGVHAPPELAGFCRLLPGLHAHVGDGILSPQVLVQMPADERQEHRPAPPSNGYRVSRVEVCHRCAPPLSLLDSPSARSSSRLAFAVQRACKGDASPDAGHLPADRAADPGVSSGATAGVG